MITWKEAGAIQAAAAGQANNYVVKKINNLRISFLP